MGHYLIAVICSKKTGSLARFKKIKIIPCLKKINIPSKSNAKAYFQGF